MATPANTKTITEGPISRTIISLAAPVVMAQFFEFALASTDYFWVGKLGAHAQDAITTSMVTIWTLFSAIGIVSVGITAVVSRNMGAQNPERAAFYSRQGLAMGVIMASVITVAAMFLSPAAMRFMDTEPETLTLAVPYMRTVYAFSVCFFLMDISYAIFRAVGDTRTPMMIGIGMVQIGRASCRERV